jgi:hypothetical protein
MNTLLRLSKVFLKNADELYVSEEENNNQGGLMLAGSVIIRLYECNSKFHVVAQGFSGKIYHEIFVSEIAARAYLSTIHVYEVPCEKV